MYLYHGTDTKFDYFELEALKKNRLDFGRGLYLSFSEEHAKSIGQTTILENESTLTLLLGL